MRYTRVISESENSKQDAYRLIYLRVVFRRSECRLNAVLLIIVINSSLNCVSFIRLYKDQDQYQQATMIPTADNAKNKE